MSEKFRLRAAARTLTLVAVTAGMALLAGPASATAVPVTGMPVSLQSAAGSDASVTLVHGVRGLLADVVVDGKTILKGFAYERASSPLQLTAGTYHVQVFKAGEPHTNALLDVHLTVKAGQQITAAVGFDSAGNPKAYVFNDALAGATQSAASIVVRNVSQGTGPRVVLDGKTINTGLASGGQVIKGVSAGRHTVGLKIGNTWLLTAQPVEAQAGKAMAVYIVGRQSAKSVALVADPITPTAAADAASVDTGGLAPVTSDPLLPRPLALGLLGAGLAGFGLLMRRRRPLASAASAEPDAAVVRRGAPDPR
jgi:hypothetical protein